MKNNTFQTVKNTVKVIRARSTAQKGALLLQAANPGVWASTYKVEYEKILNRRASLQKLSTKHSNDKSIQHNSPINHANSRPSINRKATQSLPQINTDQKECFKNNAPGKRHMIISQKTEENDAAPKDQCKHTNNRKSERRLLNVYARNQGYFAHVSGACLCGICRCGGCKCDNPRKLSVPVEPLNKSTAYRDSFTGKEAFEKTGPIRKSCQLIPKFKESANPSIYQGDYGPIDSKFVSMSKQIDSQLPVRTNQVAMKKLKAPFPKQSVYKENFPDWVATTKPMKIDCPVISTTDNRFPFFCKVTSKDYGNFTQGDVTKNFNRQLFGKQQFKNPIGSELVLSLTSTNQEFLNKALGQTKEPVIAQKRLRMSKVTIDPSIPNFMNQFKTNYQEYGQAKPEICPSKVIILKKNRDSIFHAARKSTAV